MNDPMNTAGHAVSLGGIGATLMGWLPPALSIIATLFAITFYALSAYDKYLTIKDRKWQKP